MKQEEKSVVPPSEDTRKLLTRLEQDRLKQHIDTQAQKWVDSVWDKQTKEMLRYKSDKK